MATDAGPLWVCCITVFFIPPATATYDPTARKSQCRRRSDRPHLREEPERDFSVLLRSWTQRWQSPKNGSGASIVATEPGLTQVRKIRAIDDMDCRFDLKSAHSAKLADYAALFALSPPVTS